MMTIPKLARVSRTYREHALLPDDGERHEVIAGELLVSPAPSLLHQTVSRRLPCALVQPLEESRLA